MAHIRRLLLFFIFCIALSVCAFAASAQVDQMQVALNVDQNGTARAEVTLHAVLEDSLDSFSIGLGSNVSGVHVEGYTAHVTHVGNQSTVLLSNAEGLPSSLNLTIAYTVRNTVTASGDVQSFAVRLLGGLKDADIEHLTATVQMPAAFEAIPAFSSGYYAEGIDNYLDISVTEEGLITVSNTEAMLAGETLDLGLDTELGYFTLQNVAGRTLPVDRILLIVLALLGALYWWRSLRSSLPVLTNQTQAPMETEPGTAAAILTGEAPDLALMVMSWACNGYVRVVQQGRRVVVQRMMPMGNERLSYEQAAFNRLFSKGTDAVCGSKIWKAARKTAVQQGRAFWNQRLLHEKPGRPRLLRTIAVLFCTVAALSFADQALPSMYLRVLLLVLITVAGLIWGIVLQKSLKQVLMRRKRRPILMLALCLAVMILAWRIGGHGSVLLLAVFISVLTQAALMLGPRRMRSGVNLQAELLSWRRYLRKLSRSDAQQLLQSDPNYYYRNLLFAEALGVGRPFSRAFEGIKLDECVFLLRESKPVPRMPEAFRPFFLHMHALERGEAVRKKAPSRPAPKRRPAK